MRPKKVILCVGADEWRLSLRVFLLQTWGYDVLPAASAKEALAVLSNRFAGTVDLIIAELPVEGLNASLFVTAKRMHPQLHILVTCDHAGWYDSLGADVLLAKGGDSAAELLEQVRVLVVRRRGPRKAGEQAEDRDQGTELEKKPVSRALPLFGSKSKRRVA